MIRYLVKYALELPGILSFSNKLRPKTFKNKECLVSRLIYGMEKSSISGLKTKSSCKYIIYRSFFVLRGAGGNGTYQLYH